MTGVRFADVQGRPAEFLNLTSLTLEEFEVLVTPFEAAFQDHMAAWRLDGKPRSYVATATKSGLQETPSLRSITPSFQEDTGYGRTTYSCRFEGQAGRVVRQYRRSGEADRPASGRSSAC